MHTYSYLTLFCFSEPEEAINALGELQKISRPVAISFNEMLNLMDKCQQLDNIIGNNKSSINVNGTSVAVTSRGILFNSPFSLFSGIIPGKRHTRIFYLYFVGNYYTFNKMRSVYCLNFIFSR